nr:unnamed protein product [Callosobruchus analis]
MHLYTLFD